jgi:hypothetical protein
MSFAGGVAEERTELGAKDMIFHREVESVVFPTA